MNADKAMGRKMTGIKNNTPTPSTGHPCFKGAGTEGGKAGANNLKGAKKRGKAGY